MSKTEIRNAMAAMRDLAAKAPRTDVKRNFRSPSGRSIEVIAHANRIGFVRWMYDGSPMPKSRVEWVLEMSTPE